MLEMIEGIYYWQGYSAGLSVDFMVGAVQDFMVVIAVFIGLADVHLFYLLGLGLLLWWLAVLVGALDSVQMANRLEGRG